MIKASKLNNDGAQTNLQKQAKISKLVKQDQLEELVKVKARIAVSLEEIKDNVSKIS